ncbi:hypothetical protein OJF2_14980 [Aquisphaera giovannonii]|uniref:Carboxypeptidase regulatory-like domain-containing protein n=1 Tax=Aquisphaera giovannonii TaxID=406548 RepID=A0A5B9VYE9_9BACT|nr:carboxypeptidase-like regulatory domain-containing protein [Aquisphaera giovannonii]QEH33004.1 hypothetical protein OJF2_14980 [Aquisphaera giovannonii]
MGVASLLLAILVQVPPAGPADAGGRGGPATRPIAGRIVDAKGMPVGGATVFQSGDAPARTEASSDAKGRFRLEGVAAADTFVFARAKGFRFAGRGVKEGEGEVTITMAREGEPPAARVATLAPGAAADREAAAARRLIDGYAAKVFKGGDTGAKVQVLQVLARLDPMRTLELTEGEAVSEPYLKGMVRMLASTALLESSPEDALTVAEAIDEPSGKVLALLKAADATPAAEKTKRLELLDRAIVGAKAAREPTGIRDILLGQVAERWLDMGLAEKGRALLREIQPDVERLPDAAFGGYAKGAFAEELCQIDLDAALRLTKGLTDPSELDRHHGNIAHELAGKDPEAAERVLGMVKSPYQHDQYVVRVVHRMASVDLPRARRVAATAVDAVIRGYALGMGALGLAVAKKTDDAIALLREAMDVLDTAGEYGRSPTRSPCDRASTCAALVSVAERIHPDLVPETFWRALSLRSPGGPGGADGPDAFCDYRAGLLLTRFDRGVARTLVERRLRAGTVGERGLAYAAAAVIDPAWAVQLVEGLAEDADLRPQGEKNSARLAAAAALSRRGEARWTYLQSRYAYLWVADTEDIATDL